MLTETRPFTDLNFHLIDPSVSVAQPPREQDKRVAIAKRLYMDLIKPEVDEARLQFAQTFLQARLDVVSSLEDMPVPLPDQLADMPGWIESNNHRVGLQYREYLQARRGGAPRRYFSTKSHALYFLQSVAPTKLVDGAWLYGFTRHWNQHRYANLINIYLEELGDGRADKNHVLLYRKLLEDNGCNHWQRLGEQYFTQGAIQLALGHNVERYLPEVLGYNLGYEQLPLHLLITAFELNELDIGPYYFTLHVTVDNAASGHAHKSLRALLDSYPQVADGEEFLQRVRNGYKLNELGMDTSAIIDSFDLYQELIAIFTAKSGIGQHMHSDFCRINGRTVNQWLADPALIPAFIDSLVQAGWIKRHQDPMHSRFWKLLQGEGAEMFGVFSAYERQVIYDWIAGDALKYDAIALHADQHCQQDLAQNLSYRTRQRLQQARQQPEADTAAQPARPHGLDLDSRQLEDRIAAMEQRADIMQLLADYMSPALHHTPVGLLATRIYRDMFA